MTEPRPDLATRRQFLQDAGRTAAAASALAGVAIPAVHAGEDNTIRLALIGSGNRGSGAVVNALSAPGGPVELVAMADLFPERIEHAHETLHDQFPDKVNVPPERRFLGLDAYRKAIDCLKPGDVALLTTHAAFRPTHLDYAVEKGVNVFMEKSFAADPAGVKQVLRAAEAADAKNLKVAAGLMCRHSVARQEMIRRIRDGVLGPISLIRAYRTGGPIVLGPWPKEGSELLWQVRNAVFFHWASCGLFAEMTIHQIDECCWIMDGWPIQAQGLGGRAADNTDCSQNLDSYSVEYTFANGSKALVQGRYQRAGHTEFATYVHGTRCAGQFSGNIHAATVHLYNDGRVARDNIAWRADPEPCDPWQAEWNDLLAAIRADAPYNEAGRAALASLAAQMGRAAVHGSTIVTWDEMTSSNFQFCPDLPTWTETSPAPCPADARGRYEVPVPGRWVEV